MMLEPHAPDPACPRLTTAPLPSYRYLPGINKHPVRDPAGHSFGRVERPVVFLSPESWRDNANYLYGIDLYNYAYWWEAHEAWESVWLTTAKQSPHGQFLQGLIQIAAAFLKWHAHDESGLKKLFELGTGRLDFVRSLHPIYMGLDLHEHLVKLRRHFGPMLTDSSSWRDPLRNYPFLVL